MVDNSYKIELGVKLNTSDLKTEIDKIDPNKDKVELGVNLKVNDIRDRIKKYNSNTNNIKVKLNIDTDYLQEQINKINLGVGGNKGVSIPVNTQSLEASLKEVKDIIESVRKSIGTLDNESGMKSLLSSVNQIATALGKATDESETLIKSLSVLSKKDFSVNFGIDMSKKNTNMLAYGREARKKVIPELESQIKYLESLFGGQSAAASKLAKANIGFDIFQDFEFFNSDNMIKRMEAYEKYITSLKKVASMDGIDLSGFDAKFSRSATEMIDSLAGVTKAADSAEETTNKLKSIFGSNIDAEKLSAQLDSVVVSLNEIKTTVQGLSSGISIDGLTASFDRLSDVLGSLSSNFASVQKYFDSLSSWTSEASNNAAQTANQVSKARQLISDSAQDAIDRVSSDGHVGKSFRIYSDDSDKFEDEMKRLVSLWTEGRGRLEELQIETRTTFDKSLEANVTEISRAIVTYNNGLDETIRKTISLSRIGTEAMENGDEKVIRGFVETSAKYKKKLSETTRETNNFVKQQKQSVSNFTNQINQLNRAAVDQNAPRPIKDSGHLSALSSRYNEIISAIQKMGNASSDTFIEELNNVKRLISEYQSLVSELRNAENVATSLRSKDIDTVKDTYSSKLDVLISKMKSSGIYTSGFEKGAENLRSILTGATDTSGLTRFLNGLDKLESGYKRASAASKEFNQSQKTGIRVSGLQSEIRDIQRISPEIDDFEAEINGVRVTTKSLLNDLEKVKTQSDFTVVKTNFDAFVKAAKASGISITETTKETTSNFERLKSLAKEMGKLKISIAGLDESENKSEIAELTTQLDRLQSKYNELYTSMDGRLDSAQVNALNEIFEKTENKVAQLNARMADTSAVQEQERAYKELMSILKEMGSLSLNIEKLRADGGDTSKIEELESRLLGLGRTYDETKRTMSVPLTPDQSSSLDKQIEKNAADVELFKTKVADARIELAKGIKLDIELGNFDDDISSMLDKFNRLSSASDELRISKERLENAYREMELVATTSTGDEVTDAERLIRAQKKYASALERTNNLLRIQAREEKAKADADKLADDRELFQSKIDTWLKKNSAATERFGAEMLKLKTQAESCDRVKLNGLERQFKKVDHAAEQAGLKTLKLGDRIKEKLGEYMAYFSVAEVFMWVEQGLREMFNTVKEIDTAMTGLYRVTDLTAAEYNTLFDNMISSAKEYGATLNDIINATTDWVRAGFDADTALGLAEVTTMYQHISDLDYDTAAENLITAYNGFKDELNGAFDGDQVAAVNYIADVFNQLDNEFAVTSAGLGEALTRSASALDLAGNTIQETAG